MFIYLINFQHQLVNYDVKQGVHKTKKHWFALGNTNSGYQYHNICVLAHNLCEVFITFHASAHVIMRLKSTKKTNKQISERNN